MEKTYDLWIIGGDRRQCALAQALAREGHRVHTYALEQGVEPALQSPDLTGLDRAQCVILPLPALREGRLNSPLSAVSLTAEEVLDALAPGQLVCAGQVSPPLREACEERWLKLVDYFAREELAVANAVPSSEGAIQIAMEELPITLHGARVLVIGAGRLGRVLTAQLKGLGARVSLAARKPADLAWARVEGCETVRSDALAGALADFDLVINTVPAPLLGREELAGLKRDCLVIDLSSLPGGVDLAAAGELKIKTIHALGLPGRVAPLTAALAVKTTICNILSELGV